MSKIRFYHHKVHIVCTSIATEHARRQKNFTFPEARPSLRIMSVYKRVRQFCVGKAILLIWGCSAARKQCFFMKFEHDHESPCSMPNLFTIQTFSVSNVSSWDFAYSKIPYQKQPEKYSWPKRLGGTMWKIRFSPRKVHICLTSIATQHARRH